MSDQFNGLTPAEAERLFLLSEELGEAQQAIGKILRHGYESRHPDGGPTNREALTAELGDIDAVADLLNHFEDVSAENINFYRQHKLDTVNRYLHHNRVPESLRSPI